VTGAVKKFGVGASLPRKEDARFLRGRGQYVADVTLPGTLEVAFVRSPVAHGRLRGIERPQGADGRLFTADDLAHLSPIRIVPEVPGFKPSDHHPLARHKVRFVGDCIAACIGSSRGAAEDLAQLVFPDIEELAAITEPLAARAETSSLVHDEWGDNVYVQRDFQGGDIDAVRDAPVVVTVDYRMNRQSTVPMEKRAVLACWDDRRDELVVHITSQIPHIIRVGLAQALGLPVRQLHVISPDVGGGFGGKARLMPEEIVVCAIALKTRRPIRWTEDVREHLTAGVQAREHVYRITAYADERGIVKGIDAEVTIDGGAYALWHTGPFMETGMAARNIPGPYQIENFRARTWTVATNKAPLGVYRGVARPGACFAIERTIDEVARAVGRDPMAVRIDNMVRPDQMPYMTVCDMKFDNGDYPESVRRVAELVGYDAIRARQKSAEPDGRLIGVGLASFSEQSGHGAEEWLRRGTPIIAGYETATARLNTDGTLELLVAIHSHGQGMETTLAQIAHEELAIHPDDVIIRQGDTAVSPFGMGTFASRSIVMGGGAVAAACEKLRDKMALIAAHLLQCDDSDIEFADGAAMGPGGSVTLAEIGRIAHLRQEALPDGMDPVLDVTATWEPSESSGVFSYATHAAVVAVDPATGAVELLDYAVVEDCGTVVNPMVVDGQITGGVAQGIGTALYEETPYDSNGQPLATTFVDYLLPGAIEIPDIKIGHMVTPATVTKYGMKGMGEGGAIAPPAAIANALRDAFSASGNDHVKSFNETPLTPARVRAAIDG
jgi:aerobic carbon-monoxide dehydrogenase large subunit